MTEQELQERAEANISFYRHLLTYCLVNAGLMALDYYDNGKIDWAFSPC
ncbi:MAG: 2TM domain-containing protein [Flavobacteriaceae bacterium]